MQNREQAQKRSSCLRKVGTPRLNNTSQPTHGPAEAETYLMIIAIKQTHSHNLSKHDMHICEDSSIRQPPPVSLAFNTIQSRTFKQVWETSLEKRKE